MKGDKYIVVEILGRDIRVTVLRTDFSHKQITVARTWQATAADDTPLAALKEVKKILRRIPNAKTHKIVLALDSRLATTMYASVSLVRQNAKEVIDEADLDNLISQAIWRFFDKHRFKVSQKMNIDEVDVLLTDVRIRDIRIDGHRVVNPIGFKAKSVEIFFSQTFVPREFMRDIRELLPKENIVLMMEAGTALAHILSHVRGDGDFYVANLFPKHTAVFASLRQRFGHQDWFDWGGDHLPSSVSRYFHLDPDTSRALIRLYATENMSGGFSRKFEPMLVTELTSFANGIESMVGDDPSEVYVNTIAEMPPVLFSSRFQNRFRKPVKLLSLSTQFITEKLGYGIHYMKAGEMDNPLICVSSLLELALLPQEDTLSHLANRRVRWLVT
ncbi:MAG: hypothetical protein KGI60_00565 [Patescibacteria group bacterium]|nr:hypothetical protein [Patescibacteria group bacterium]